MPYQLVAQQSIQRTKPEGLTHQQKEVITLIEQHHLISTIELRDKLSFSPSERWVRDTLGKLKKFGYVDVVGHTTARKWFLIKK